MSLARAGALLLIIYTSNIEIVARARVVPLSSDLTCIGVGCQISCSTVGCIATCIGNRCKASCDADKCLAVCIGEFCHTECKGAHCKQPLKSIGRSSGSRRPGKFSPGVASESIPIGDYVPGSSISPTWYYDTKFVDYVDRKWKRKYKNDKKKPIVPQATFAPPVSSPLTLGGSQPTPIPAVLVNPHWYYDKHFVDYVDRKWRGKRKQKESKRVLRDGGGVLSRLLGDYNGSRHGEDVPETAAHVAHDIISFIFPMESVFHNWLG